MIYLCWIIQTIQCRDLVVLVTTMLNIIVSCGRETKDAAGGRRGNSV